MLIFLKLSAMVDVFWHWLGISSSGIQRSEWNTGLSGQTGVMAETWGVVLAETWLHNVQLLQKGHKKLIISVIICEK